MNIAKFLYSVIGYQKSFYHSSSYVFCKQSVVLGICYERYVVSLVSYFIL